MRAPRTSSSRAGASLSKRLAFMALNAGFAVATGFSWFVVFPDFPVPRGLVLVPLAAISLLIAAGLHAAVLRTASHLLRAVALYGAFVLTIVLLGALDWYLLDLYDLGGAISAALLYGHIFGLPVLFVTGLVNHWLSPVLCPRRA